MTTQDEIKLSTTAKDDETILPHTIEHTETLEDTDPPLDEEDLEENNLTVEEADQIVWEEPEKSSSGNEEKDITD